MTDSEWTPPKLLQLVILGALLADKKLRDEVDSGNFTTESGIAAAVAELRTSKGKQAFPALKALLRNLGVEWDEKEKPLRRMIQRCKLNGEVARVLDYLAAMDAVTSSLPSEQAQNRFLEAVANIRRDLNIDLSVCVKKQPTLPAPEPAR